MFSRVKRNYCDTSWDEGEYEFYMPTRERIDGANMQFYRVIVKVVPEIDRETIRREHRALLKPRIKPAGVMDSELVVFVAPRRTEKGIKERQFLRGFRHRRVNDNHYSWLTAIIINKAPEICMKRLLVLGLGSALA